MCGRYTYYSSEELLKRYELQSSNTLQTALTLPDNYNVAPSALMPFIVRGEQEHRLELGIWGLVPSWIKQPESALKLINARREGLLEKPIWKRLVNSKRCIVPARGFYEWKTDNGKKFPFYITPKLGDVLNFAGLWDDWHDANGSVLISYTIITTTPNKEMSAIHTRMPAILDSTKAERWLEPTALNQDELDDLLAPLPDNSLSIERVSTAVNNTRNNSKDLIYPLSD